MARRFLIHGILFLTPIFLGFGCSGDGVGLNSSGDPLPGNGGDEDVISFSTQIQPIVDTHCTRCHAPGGIGYLGTGGDVANGLDLTDGASYDGLVGVETFEDPQDPPRYRVLAFEPDSSFLLEKIVSDTPKSGFRMPLDGPPFLTDGEVETIERWIEEGAVDN
jgi:hypothetical protein